MLIGSEDREIVVESFRCGARGVLSVNDSSQDLRKCMAAVLRGNIWASGTHLTYLVEAFAQTRASVWLDLDLKALTQCEDEILQCLAAGLTDRQIGSRLRVPENRIRKYISGMLQKAGVSSRAELTLLAPSEDLRGIDDKGSDVPEEEVGT
jgi:DNA-binding NarL/FixJ family response regulator